MSIPSLVSALDEVIPGVGHGCFLYDFQSGSTALHVAAAKGCEQVVHLLLAHRASVAATTKVCNGGLAVIHQSGVYNVLVLVAAVDSLGDLDINFDRAYGNFWVFVSVRMDALALSCLLGPDSSC